jgi:hypothetical protein
MRKRRAGLKPICRILGQRPLYGAAQRFWRVHAAKPGQWRWWLDRVLNGHMIRLSKKWPTASQGFVDTGRQRILVCTAGGFGLYLVSLRGHVIVRAHRHVGACQRRIGQVILIEVLGDSKVAQIGNASRIEEDIRGLDVAVKDFQVVGMIESGSDCGEPVV